MARQTYAYLGSGKIKLREIGGNGGLIPIGNCSALTFGAESNSLTLTDYTKPGGGTYATVNRVGTVNVTMTCHDFDAANLARAAGGAFSVTTAGTVSKEPAVAYKGATVVLSRAPSAITTVTGIGGTPAYTAGTDYLVTPAGIEILTSGTIPDSVSGAANIEVTYENTAQQVMQAMVNSGKEYELLFEGLNEAESDKPVIVHAYRVKFAPAQAINFIGDDFGSLELVGTALQDASKVGEGISKYWNVRIVE